MILTGEIVVPREEPVTASHCPPEIPRGHWPSLPFLITRHIEFVPDMLHMVTPVTRIGLIRGVTNLRVASDDY
jgi:hypothetical protein